MRANNRAKQLGKRKKTPVKTPVKVAQPHGGALLVGGNYGNKGGGRLKEEVRRAYLELGATKGLSLVSSVLDGHVPIRLFGECPQCKFTGLLPEGPEYTAFMEKIRASVDQQLKANEQALKYSLGTQDEMTLTSEQVKGLCQAYSASVMQIVAEETPDAFLRIQARMEEQLAQVGV